MATVDLVIPVYNEEHVLENSVATVRSFLQENVGFDWRIVIADNASTDRTLDVARRLAEQYSDVTALHIPMKGRGRALKAAWLGSDADVVSYMDVDLSTALVHYPPLIGAILDEGYDVAIGTRLASQSRIRRSLKRELLSRGYNLIIRAMFLTRFSDAQCGFKAVSRRAVQALLPLIEDGEWFFDTELLILAEKLGYRIKEIPVRWVEDPDTRVHIVRTVRQDLEGLWRVRTRTLARARRALTAADSR